MFPDRYARWGGMYVADGSGGAYFGWADYSVNARVLRLDSGGDLAPGWTPHGRSFDDAGVSQSYGAPGLVPDGSGGVLMLGGVEVAGGAEIRGQRFDADGARLWADGGVTIRGTGVWPAGGAAVSDGAGGAIVALLEDPDGGTSDLVLRAQHVTATGVRDPAWPAEGTLLSGGDITGGAGAYWAVWSVSDGAGGAIVVWIDGRNYATTGIDLYAQRVTSGGTIAAGWPADGKPLCRAPGDQANGNPMFLSMASDGGGGAYVAWVDPRSGWEIYATRVRADGTLAPGWDWNPDGTRAQPDDWGDAGGPIVVPSADGVIVFRGMWYPGLGGAVYMAKLVDGGVVSVSAVHSTAPGGAAIRIATANPSAGRILFTLWLPRESPVRVDVVDANGRSIRMLMSSTLGEGSHRLEWDGQTHSGSRATSGLYFLRVRTAGHVATQKFTILR